MIPKTWEDENGVERKTKINTDCAKWFVGSLRNGKCINSDGKTPLQRLGYRHRWWNHSNNQMGRSAYIEGLWGWMESITPISRCKPENSLQHIAKF